MDLSFLDGMLGMLGNLAQGYFMTGENPMRVGSSHQSVVPYGRFPTSDGHLVVALMVESFYVKFCVTIGHPELAIDRRFATTVGRKQNRELLEQLVGEIMTTRSSPDWQAIFDRHGRPVRPGQCRGGGVGNANCRRTPSDPGG